jgi:hypothetical protein
MEPSTYALNPCSTELKYPGKWEGSRIEGFLRATQNESLDRLRMVCVLTNQWQPAG